MSATLESGVRDQVRKALYVRLALLKREYRAAGRLEAMAPVFALVERFTGAAICDLATPFFWFNTLRADPQVRFPERQDDWSLGFAVTAADSFLPQLPVGASVELAFPFQPGEYAFPRIGFSYELAPGCVLQRTDDGMAVALPGRPGHQRAVRSIVTRVPGYPDTTLLQADDRTLFHDEYRAKIAADTPTAQPLAAMIASSLNLIDDLAPALAAQIGELVKWYVPLRSTDFRIHNSFTASTLLGVIFLSDAYDDFRLAEAIVHEYHHNQLFCLMAGETLFDPEPAELYYSPWREDARPLTGLFHALYVFSNVLKFLELARAKGAGGTDPAVIAREIDRMAWRLAIAYRQVPLDRVTPAGRAILEEVAEVAGAAPASDPPADVVRHAGAWQARHPSLTLCPW